MKKLAIYVEGQTEQIFISKLVKEIAGKNNIVITLEKLHGGNQYSRSATCIKAQNNTNNEQFYVLIRDCGGDKNVQSDIKDNIEKHSKQGFEKIIGVRDVYPFDKDKLSKLIMYSKSGIPTRFIPFKIIFTVMEVEAWFLGEQNHFSLMHNDLTPNKINEFLGFPLTPENIENINQPAATLNDIYNLAGLCYDKRYDNVKRVVECLDIENMYMNTKDQMKSLGLFTDEIDSFVT